MDKFKIFISWSGDRSKRVATVMKDWVETVFQTADAWMSEVNLDAGTFWNSAIQNELNSRNFGILCVDSSNQASPWLLFEAGALSKGNQKNRVCPVLIDIDPSDLKPPLSTLNIVRMDPSGLQKLASTINKELSEPLDSAKLARTFEAHWSLFEPKFREAAQVEFGPAEPPRSDRELLKEILEISRGVSKALPFIRAKSLSSSVIAFSTEPGWARMSGCKSYPLLLRAEKTPEVLPLVVSVIAEELGFEPEDQEEARDEIILTVTPSGREKGDMAALKCLSSVVRRRITLKVEPPSPTLPAGT